MSSKPYLGDNDVSFNNFDDIAKSHMPSVYGKFNMVTNAIVSGSGNFSATRIATGRVTVTVDAGVFEDNNYLVMISSPSDAAGNTSRQNSLAGSDSAGSGQTATSFGFQYGYLGTPVNTAEIQFIAFKVVAL